MVTLILLCLLAPLTAWAQPPRLHEPEQSRPWAVYFSPDGRAEQAVAEAVARARDSVLVHTVALSSPAVIQALVDAHDRGVDVQIIEDGTRSSRDASMTTLARAGIPILTDVAHVGATTNSIVIDNQVVITGSLGFAPAIEGSVLVIHDPVLAARYAENWRVHAAHAQRSSRTP